jgi:H+/Cl- antiporter ClcA
MACMFTAVFHAPVTAMIMAFEITHDYGILLPAMLACTLSHLFSRPARVRTRPAKTNPKASG